MINYQVAAKSKPAEVWINDQKIGDKKTMQEKAKYLVGKVMTAKIPTPRPSVWWEVLKLAAGVRDK